MRRHDDARGHRVAAGVQQGNAGTIGVAQQNGCNHAQMVQQLGQNRPGLVVHIVGQQSPLALPIYQSGFTAHIGHGVGITIAPAGVNPAFAPRSLANLMRPVAPHGDGPEPLMQEDDRRTAKQLASLIDASLDGLFP